MKIQVDIEQLVLEGIDIPVGQRPLLQAAFEAELARLLAAGGLNPALLQGNALTGLRAGAMPWSGKDDPAQLGQKLARSVYGGIGAAEEKQ